MQKLWRRYWHGSDLGAILVLISISVGMFWKITLTNQYTWLNSPDFSQQVAPWFQFQAREWHQHRFPLWDPYHWAGQPLIGPSCRTRTLKPTAEHRSESRSLS